MFFSISAIKAANKAAGQFFFERNTMSFFQSRVSRKLHGHYFVTSERPRWDQNARRSYTVRMVTDDGLIHTLGEFGQFATSKQAHEKAARMWRRDSIEIRMDEEADAGRWEAYCQM